MPDDQIAPSSDTTVGAAGFLGGMLGVRVAPNLMEATDRVMKDSDLMTHWLERYANCSPDKVQGRAFEFLETLKFNEQAARVGSDLHASTTQMVTPTGPVDIEILRGPADDVVREVQAKSYGDPGAAIRTLAHAKYHGQGRLVPADQEAELRARLAGRSANHLSRSQQDDVKGNLMGRLEHEGVQSRGTTRLEADFAARYPQLEAWLLEGRASLAEVGAAGATGALASGGFGVLFSSLQQGASVWNGAATPQQAMLNTLRGGASAAVRGGAVSAGARAIAIAGRHHGFSTFAGGTAPVAIASCSYEAGRCVYRYVQGDIAQAELWEGVGGAMLRCSAAYYCGLAGQVLIPIPVVGALVGATVGYVTSATLIQSGLLGMGPSNQVAAMMRRREEIERLCRRSVQCMAECRFALEILIEQQNAAFATEVVPALDLLETQILDGNAQSTIEALGIINRAFGGQLPFRDFQDFDAFMSSSDTRLQL